MTDSNDYRYLKNDVYGYFGNLRCITMEDGTQCTNPHLCSFIHEYRYSLISKNGLIPKPDNDLDLCTNCRYNSKVIGDPSEYIIDLHNHTHDGCLYHILSIKWEGQNDTDTFIALCKSIAGMYSESDQTYLNLKSNVALNIYQSNGGDNA